MATDYSNWMWENYDLLKNKKLRRICLPGNHDSATSKLQEIWTEERGPVPWKYKLFTSIFGWDLIINLAKATGKDIKAQLNDGLRAFDFRVWRYKDKFFSVHRILGEDYETIFRDICHFLDSRRGEILLLQFLIMDYTTGIEKKRELTPDEKKFREMRIKDRKDFAEVLKNILGKYAILRSRGEFLGPLECTYGLLVDHPNSASEFRHSQVIINFEGEGVPDDEIFCSVKDLRLRQAKIDDIGKEYMEEFNESQKLPISPFMLSLIHTPKDDEVERIIKYYMFNRRKFRLLPWRTLRELAKPYNQQVRELFNRYNLPNKKNGISIAYIDYHEDGAIVDEAITRSCSQ